jgi:methionyl aminopeptidase
MITIKSPEQIEIMAEGGKRLGEVLRQLIAATHEGVTTKQLDRIAYELIHKSGAKPAFLHYKPNGAKKAYPYTLCASINDVVVHGQPSSYAIQDGDLVKLDLGLIYKGFYLDAARTVVVGRATKEAKKLASATREALQAGIREAKPGKTVGDIGFAIEKVIKKNNFSAAEGLVGHGIGRVLHEDPAIFNFGRRGAGEELSIGMVIAIEPMVNIGGGATRQVRSDESYATKDGSLSAHFENTVAITEKGPRVLTER